VGSLVGAALAVLALVFAGASRDLLLLLALLLPGLLVQDTARVVMLASERPSRAAVNDLGWALLQACGLGLLLASGHDSGELLFLAWAVAGAVCGVLGCLQLRIRPAIRRGAAWLHEHRGLGGSYAIESVAFAGSTQLTTLVVAGVGGLAAAGALRAGQAIYGPASVLLLMLRIAGIAESRAALAVGRNELRRMVRFLGAGGAAVGAIILAAVLLLPDEAGRWLFGDTWALASVLLLPLGLQKVVTGYSVGAFAGLRVIKAARLTLMLRLLTALLTFAGGVVGAFIASAEGSAYGLFVGTLLGVIPMRIALARLMSR
jgi:O-antigen/teichoic acid export membrane protein